MAQATGHSTAELKEVDRVELTVLIEEAAGFVPYSEGPARPTTADEHTLLGQHGLSILATAATGNSTCRVLFDGGISEFSLMYNARKLGVDFADVNAVVLSHGHGDHFGGLPAALRELPSGVPLVLHPNAFCDRRKRDEETGEYRYEVRLDEEDLRVTGVDLVMATEPQLLCGGLVLTTGEVERTTSFETTIPSFEARIDGAWVVDPLIDDQALVFHVRNRGLVIVGGCSHSGIVNICRYAQKLTGVGAIHAVLGGFHLGGRFFEPRIEPTVDELASLRPDVVVPMHCTGWKATRALSLRLPEQFRTSASGATFVFEQ